MTLVAVVGRPNVGKSTLINRIIGKREAIVDKTPGVTRDRKYVDAKWNDRLFTLTDTGGLEFADSNGLGGKVRDQALFAVNEADVILFIVDGQTGLLGDDEEIADTLRRTTCPVIVVVNKWDDPRIHIEHATFYKLGLGDPIPVSSLHGIGIGDLLDHLVDVLPAGEAEKTVAPSTISIVGRPNVGKSSIFNKLIGDERVIISDKAGTTRDAIDSLLEKDGHPYLFIDTAGLRRKGKRGKIEHFSSVRVSGAIDRADLVMLITDAVSGITDQDRRIAAMVDAKGRAMLVLLNKWDLVKGESAEPILFEAHNRLSFVSYSPIVSVSALTSRGIEKLFPLIEKAEKAYHRRIQTSELNLFVEQFRDKLEGRISGKPFRIMYATQVRAGPPTIVFFTNLRRTDNRIGANYRRYLENLIREHFSFEGTPIKIRIRSKD